VTRFLYSLCRRQLQVFLNVYEKRAFVRQIAQTTARRVKSLQRSVRFDHAGQSDGWIRKRQSVGVRGVIDMNRVFVFDDILYSYVYEIVERADLVVDESILLIQVFSDKFPRDIF
jgi:hypothetical protein